MQTTTRAKPRTDVLAEIERRIAALDWADIERSLDTHGCAMAGPLLTVQECAALSALYPQDAPFRSRIVMARHGFGRGEYKYFAYPLPEKCCAGVAMKRNPPTGMASHQSSCSTLSASTPHSTSRSPTPSGVMKCFVLAAKARIAALSR